MSGASTAEVPEKTADELHREIDELHRQQREISERLRDPRGIRRASLAQNGPRVRPRGFVRPVDNVDSEDQPPAKRRLSSAVVKVGGGDSRNLEDGENHDINRDADPSPTEAAATDNSNGDYHRRTSKVDPQETGGFRRQGNPRFTRMDYSVPTSDQVPRVLPKEEDPSLVKRNRRMLGQLLGTLEKFQQEDKKLSSSEAYLRRSDSLQRAEQRAKEESERLRQQEREQITMKRRRDLTLRARIAAKAEEKKLELLFIRWSEHHKRLCNFLRTKAEPPIYYLPTRSLEDDSITSDERKRQIFAEWKSDRRAELTEFQKKISEQLMGNVEGELERWEKTGRSKRVVENLQESMDKELESHQMERGPKTRCLPSGDALEDEDVDDIAADDDPMDDMLGNAAVDDAAHASPTIHEAQ